MKSILLSIKPKYVAKILNGKKTIEVRKKFPKDYKGWVYIYCTKGKERLVNLRDDSFYCGMSKRLNGKVVARFYCDKVEEIFQFPCKHTDTQPLFSLLINSCLSFFELENYLGDKEGYAIHISNLEIFDRPKELSEFRRWFKVFDEVNENTNVLPDYPVTKAPQNYMFIEVEE